MRQVILCRTFTGKKRVHLRFIGSSIIVLLLSALCILGALALGRTLPDRAVAYAARSGSDSVGLYLLDTTRGIQRRIVDNSEGFAWSPDGRLLAYLGMRPAGDGVDIFVLDIEGGQRSRVSDDTFFDFLPTWSPDGTQLAYLSTRDSNQVHMIVADMRTGQYKSLAALSTDRLVWSPDGGTLLFNGVYHEFPSIFRLSVQTGDISLLTPSFPLSQNATWSPDGQQIAFIASQNRGYGLYVMAASGLYAQQISPPDIAASWPAWSPDGTRILFVSIGGSTPGLYTIATDGKDLRRVVDNPFIASQPVWSPDSQHILYAARVGQDTNRLFMVDADGTHNRPLTREDGFVLAFAWRP
jgi:TolB protein